MAVFITLGTINYYLNDNQLKSSGSGSTHLIETRNENCKSNFKVIISTSCVHLVRDIHMCYFKQDLFTYVRIQLQCWLPAHFFQQGYRKEHFTMQEPQFLLS